MPVIAVQTSMHYFNPKLSPISNTHVHSHTAHSRMQTHTYKSVIALCAYTSTHAHTQTWLAGLADGVGLMYFDDMKVDHIYMQIEVPD